MWIASLAWVLLVLGYLSRKRRSHHVPLVLSGIILDIGLVIFLEITRGAVETALRFEKTVPQQIHIGFSATALFLYIPVIFFGIRLIRGVSGPRIRVLHKRFAIGALLFRTLGFLFMFSMWK